MLANSKVSVIISSYSTERLNSVLECIKFLKKQTFPADEIILVVDPSKTLFEFYKSRVPNHIKLIISDGFGLSNARNAGVKHAEGEIVSFIDDDAIPDRDWLKNLVKNYDKSFIVGVGGLIKPVWEDGRPMWFPEELDWMFGCSYKGLPEHKTYIRNPIGCNVSFRKDIFKKIGYFRGDIGRFGKKLAAGEEAELCIRIIEKVPFSKIVYDPQAIVYHKIPKSRTKLILVMKTAFYQGFSKAYFAKLNTLSVEGRYLKYLLQASVPKRLKHIYKLRNASELLVLLTMTFLVLTGYIAGRLNRGINYITSFLHFRWLSDYKAGK